MSRLLPLLFCLLPVGCIGLDIERQIIGSVDAVHEAKKLEKGKVTLSEAITRLGPPDLLLQTGKVDRLYYTYWDSEYYKFIVELDLSLGNGGFSWDIFIVTWGGEDLHIARLDFDRKGVLIRRDVTKWEFTTGGEYAAIDNTIVSNFLEDRARALSVDDEEFDDHPDDEKKE